jgi:uncharacterized membrane protein
MATPDKPSESTPVAPRTANSTLQYVTAIVLIFSIGTVAVVLAPEQAVAIMAFCGSVLVSLFTILNTVLKGQAELKEAQVQTHDAVNGKMEKMIGVIEESEFAKGKLAQKEENNVAARELKNKPPDQPQK